MPNNRMVIFWLNSIENMTPAQIERYQYYQSLYEKAGYKVSPMELENFMGNMFSNSVVHVGGHGSPLCDCFEVFENIEKDGQAYPGLFTDEGLPEFSYPIIEESQKDIFVLPSVVSIVGVGTKQNHKLYLVEKGKWSYQKTVSMPSQKLPLFKNTEEALEKSTGGQVVRIGFPKSFIVYRVSENKDNKTGATTKVLNFQYIV